MRHFALILGMLVCWISALPVACAKGKEKDVEAEALAAVPAVLADAPYMTKAKPNLKAKYYGFIRSASWCMPCKVFVPPVMKDYSKMRGMKMELIFLGQEDKEVVLKYAKDSKFKCPVVMPGEIGASIPGLKFEGGQPRICIVDADGNFVGEAGGKNMQGWRDMVKEYQNAQRKKQAEEKRAAAKKKKGKKKKSEEPEEEAEEAEAEEEVED